MKTLIVGAGAIGVLLAGILASNGADVILFTRRPEAAQMINRDGVHILTKEKKNGIRAFPRCVTSLSEAANSELAIVAVKAYETEEAAWLLKNNLGEECLVVTVQNGFNNLATLADTLGGDRVLGGVTTQAATQINTTTIFHAHDGATTIGHRDAAKARAVASFLTEHGVNTRIADDIEAEIWAKSTLNCVINPLTALTGVKNGQLLDMPSFREIASSIIRECTEVSRRHGIFLPENKLLERLVDVIVKTAENKSSMLQDILRGRRTEINQLNGWIASQAEKMGVETPLNRLLTGLVTMLEMKLISRPAYKPAGNWHD